LPFYSNPKRKRICRTFHQTKPNCYYNANRGIWRRLRKMLSGFLIGGVCAGQLVVFHDYYITTRRGGVAVGRINDRPQASLIHLYRYRCSAVRHLPSVLYSRQAPRRPRRSSAVLLGVAAPPHNQYFIALVHTLISRRDVIRYEHKLSSLSNYL